MGNPEIFSSETMVNNVTHFLNPEKWYIKFISLLKGGLLVTEKFENIKETSGVSHLTREWKSIENISSHHKIILLCTGTLRSIRIDKDELRYVK